MEDRAELFEGPSSKNIALAQQFISISPARFTSVEALGRDAIAATGYVQYGNGVTMGPAGPLRFVAEDGRWKIAREWACRLTQTC
ncbi:hypothetical protein FOS14_08900 [Skermania sp. ID1734]|uniref:hypothetical protein n=1 Tax=Skermania sp. ID1734 TaxID=2597516 RepID=UPI00117E9AC8|nr:hypothetical protein [Skermania sp. ID1734]TSD99942.1 hypothetical protein FOS14_08900 [Skermania sp. ID1734]